MNTAHPLLHKLTPELGFDILRIYLGAGLAIRGGLFLGDPTLLQNVAASPDSVVPQLIALGHIAGGLLLAAGFFTRLAALAQAIPVLGAVLLVHGHEQLASANQSLEFTGLVLAMLIFYSCFGAGPWSLDHRRRQAARAD